jgi:hypothetical protein
VNDGTVDSNIATATITVRPVNDAPTLAPATFTVPENSGNPTPVGTVTGSDVDGDSLTYSIIGGNTGGAFAIDSNTGAIRVANPSMLNYEITPFFDLLVQVRDSAGATGTATIRINLTDVPEELEVAIDVKPGDEQNRINSKSNGKLEVAILSTADFNAQLIDIDSLRFGLTGTEDSISQHPEQGPRFRYEDVNGDGRLDLVVRFEIELTGLQPDSTKAILTGSLLDGTSFMAENGVSMK